MTPRFAGLLLRRLPLALVALAPLLIAAACGGDGDDEPDPGNPGGNLLINGSVENGSEPWFSLAENAGFTVTDARASEGTFSALERMRDQPSTEGSGPTMSKVYYLVQEITPAEFPDVVRGKYFVESWVKGVPWQYLQFVIIADGPTNFPSAPGNYQIRYPLAGIDSQPFAIENAKYRFLGREEPVQGQWIAFEARVKDDFQELWGKVPEGFKKLRLLFEVRWDHKEPGVGAPAADVYYDELYAGSE
jgi:hypothetical protein